MCVRYGSFYLRGCFYKCFHSNLLLVFVFNVYHTIERVRRCLSLNKYPYFTLVFFIYAGYPVFISVLWPVFDLPSTSSFPEYISVLDCVNVTWSSAMPRRLKSRVAPQSRLIMNLDCIVIELRPTLPRICSTRSVIQGKYFFKNFIRYLQPC